MRRRCWNRARRPDGDVRRETGCREICPVDRHGVWGCPSPFRGRGHAFEDADGRGYCRGDTGHREASDTHRRAQRLWPGAAAIGDDGEPVRVPRVAQPSMSTVSMAAVSVGLSALAARADRTSASATSGVSRMTLRTCQVIRVRPNSSEHAVHVAGEGFVGAVEPVADGLHAWCSFSRGEARPRAESAGRGRGEVRARQWAVAWVPER